MHLEHLDIRGFGCLRTEVAFSADRLNLTIADNEAGKSTLIAAILAAFYGIVEDERVTRDQRPHRKNVLPWESPEEFGIVLDFSDGKTRWQIERDFNSRQVKLIDRDSGEDHTDRYHKGRGVYRIGEELIGLGCPDFLKSFYLKQEEILEIRDAGGLTPHVQRVATAREGEATSENALERLRQALKAYTYDKSRSPLTIENATKKLQQERDGYLSQMEELTRERADIEPHCLKLAGIEEQIRGKRSQREELQSLGDIAEMRELTRLIEAQQRLGEEFRELSAAAEELKEFDKFPAERWEQLNNIAGRVEELSATVEKQEEQLRDRIEKPLEELEEKLHDHRELGGATEAELLEFETAYSRLSDRHDRYLNSRRERDQQGEELQREGFNREQFSRLKNAFGSYNPDEIRFIENFRVSYAEEEAVYRERKTAREWVERERDLVRDRRLRVISNARLFFIMAAVMAIAGGLMMLLIQQPADWLGSVLAGLGAVFAAVGFIIRGTAGSHESSGLMKLEVDLEMAVDDEDEARKRLDEMGAQLTEMAAHAGFGDGNILMAEHAEHIRMERLSEPLLDAERKVVRDQEEADQALEQARPFFERAGDPIPDLEGAVKATRELLERYREAARLGEELRSLKGRRQQMEEELERLRRDLKSHRDLAEEILRMGGVEKTEPLDEAVAAFREALDKHRRYRSLTGDQLPRIQQELLPEVDISAKQDRQEQLGGKVTGDPRKVRIDHSKEYYRDQADRVVAEIDALNDEKLDINRRIAAVLEKYQSGYPKLQNDLAEVEERLRNAETFRSEVETAISMMGDISREVYRSWAAVLSEEATPFLQALNPRYTEIKFNEDLTFNILDSHTKRMISSGEVETVLSSGARDEVFLAARLGITAYLASGAKGPLPIILDEPLSSADDDKFLSGMNFLLHVLSRQNQVLVMSCHAERHRWLAEQMPKLFKERVHQIELASQPQKLRSARRG